MTRRRIEMDATVKHPSGMVEVLGGQVRFTVVGLPNGECVAVGPSLFVPDADPRQDCD